MSVSIILPFYKRTSDLAFSLPFNKDYFSGSNREVVLVVDEPGSEKEVIELVKQYPEIHWKVQLNPNDHEWRNPAKAINVGIRTATKEKVIIMSPETICTKDAISTLAQKTYGIQYSTGFISFATRDEIRDDNKVYYRKIKTNWGSICLVKGVLEALGGYYEPNTTYGGDDINIRRRLRMAGYKQVSDYEVQLIHSSEKYRELHHRPFCPPGKASEETLHPQTYVINSDWGRDFDNLIYST